MNLEKLIRNQNWLETFSLLHLWNASCCYNSFQFNFSQKIEFPHQSPRKYPCASRKHWCIRECLDFSDQRTTRVPSTREVGCRGHLARLRSKLVVFQNYSYWLLLKSIFGLKFLRFFSIYVTYMLVQIYQIHNQYQYESCIGKPQNWIRFWINTVEENVAATLAIYEKSSKTHNQNFGLGFFAPNCYRCVVRRCTSTDH